MTVAIVVVLVTMLLGGLGSVTAPRDVRVYVNGRRYYPGGVQIPGGVVWSRTRRESLYDARMLEPPYAPDGPAWVAYTRCQRSLAREGRMHESGRKPAAPVNPWLMAALVGASAFAICALFSRAAKLPKIEPEAP